MTRFVTCRIALQRSDARTFRESKSTNRERQKNCDAYVKAVDSSAATVRTVIKTCFVPLPAALDRFGAY
jgi:hypothetical protein